jgi:outer membrane protein OmpA-like peptidoglycan-associated protein
VAVALPAALAAASLAFTLLQPPQASAPAREVAAEVLFTAPTANDSRISLARLQGVLHAIAQRHQKILVTRVDADGKTSTTTVDLTPRVDDQPGSEILKVQERAEDAIEAILNRLENEMNVQASPPGGRSLFLGLLRAEFLKGVPVYVISSGLDLDDPVDFRKLGFDVPPAQLVEKLTAARQLPNLEGAEVEFILTPSTGQQEQLRQKEKTYVKAVWKALLEAGHASSVDFVEDTGGDSTSTVNAAPVALPPLPGTPIRPVQNSQEPEEWTCEMSAATYFVPNEAVLLDKARTASDMKDCIARVGVNSRVSLDGWTAYLGELDTAGRPKNNPQLNIDLSKERCQAVADLLVENGVDHGLITRMTGHGSQDQPYPQVPSSEKNRVVIIHISRK